ncbi:MAG: hypothetical protein WCQ50_22435, partial [Spirochaetota bacterium]
MLFDSTVAGHSRQYTTTARFAGKQDEFTIGRKAGFFLPTALSECFNLPGLKILHGDRKSPANQVRKDKGLSIRTVTWLITRSTTKRQALRSPSFNRHT